MSAVYVIHYNEIALKGQNRPVFLRQLQENICATVGLAKNNVTVVDGRILVHTRESHQDLSYKLSWIFGISSHSLAEFVPAKYGLIEEAIYKLAEELKFSTFAIRATRGDKKFAYTSKELAIKLGDFMRTKFAKKVDLESPDVTFHVEVFDGGAVVYTEKIPGPGGLPVGTEAKVAVLISGGIDSPVAAYRIMKRGAPVVGVHFHSYPFASYASIDKVKEVVKVLGNYHGQKAISLYTVPLADAQKQVVQKCNERFRVLLYRRLMWRIGEAIAHKVGAQALATGESLGQVASQTIENMAAVESVINLPILRPLIGFDKQEIINEAKRIGTYDISIQPHEDCCTLFMPRRVETKARLVDLDNEEAKVDFQMLVAAALEKAELIRNN